MLYTVEKYKRVYIGQDAAGTKDKYEWFFVRSGFANFKSAEYYALTHPQYNLRPAILKFRVFDGKEYQEC